MRQKAALRSLIIRLGSLVSTPSPTCLLQLLLGGAASVLDARLGIQRHRHQHVGIEEFLQRGGVALTDNAATSEANGQVAWYVFRTADSTSSCQQTFSGDDATSMPFSSRACVSRIRRSVV